jgi:hypothetical protein
VGIFHQKPYLISSKPRAPSSSTRCSGNKRVGISNMCYEVASLRVRFWSPNGSLRWCAVCPCRRSARRLVPNVHSLDDCGVLFLDYSDFTYYFYICLKNNIKNPFWQQPTNFLFFGRCEHCILGLRIRARCINSYGSSNHVLLHNLCPG